MGESLPILVVEDEELLLPLLQAALERGGFKVAGAASTSAALAKLQQGEFAAIVSDLRLGDGGGAAIFEWVRQYRPQALSRFLFTTGNMSDSYAMEVRERTGAAFIEKPFRIGTLVELVKTLMEKASPHA